MNRDEGNYQLSHIWDMVLSDVRNREPSEEDLRAEVEMSTITDDFSCVAVLIDMLIKPVTDLLSYCSAVRP